MSIGVLGLAFVAGLLLILSPCVLPLLPIVFGAAAGEHRAGPLALAGGVVLAFVSIGLFVGVIGFAIGLDNDVFRAAGAVLMALVGLILVAPSLQVRLATAGGPVSDWADQKISSIQSRGLAGQFGIGFLLGAVWRIPCAGPTLGSRRARRRACAARRSVRPHACLGARRRDPCSAWASFPGNFWRAGATSCSGGKGAKAALGAV